MPVTVSVARNLVVYYSCSMLHVVTAGAQPAMMACAPKGPAVVGLLPATACACAARPHVAWGDYVVPQLLATAEQLAS